jgi:hypothetical protein
LKNGDKTCLWAVASILSSEDKTLDSPTTEIAYWSAFFSKYREIKL